MTPQKYPTPTEYLEPDRKGTRFAEQKYAVKGNVLSVALLNPACIHPHIRRNDAKGFIERLHDIKRLGQAVCDKPLSNERAFGIGMHRLFSKDLPPDYHLQIRRNPYHSQLMVYKMALNIPNLIKAECRQDLVRAVEDVELDIAAKTTSWPCDFEDFGIVQPLGFWIDRIRMSIVEKPGTVDR